MTALASGRSAAPPLPEPCGPWTEALGRLVGSEPGAALAHPIAETADPLHDDDLQLALYCCYELHYAGFQGVDERLEWSPVVLMFRGALEAEFERGLRELQPPTRRTEETVGAELQRLVREDDGPPMSRYLETQATLAQAREFVVHRSAYQLKEADPHSWAIPRLRGAPKAALVEVQFDEYGGGRAERMHSALFAGTMRAVGLDPAYGAYLDRLPGITLATVNLMSLLGLHRRRRGALVGHLAVFEMTSSVPNRRYGNAWRRLGFGVEATAFHDEHVLADAVHESIAVWDLADGQARAEPETADDIVWGARALLALEALWAGHVLGAWARGETSLRREL